MAEPSLPAAAFLRYGSRTVRDPIGWYLMEKEGKFDFAFIECRARAARKSNLPVCWIADLAFAGAPSLSVAKARRHPHVHCLSSSIDVSSRRDGRA